MDKEFVPGNLAMRLMDIGFNEPCLKYKWNDKETSKWMHNSKGEKTFHTQGHFKEKKDVFTVSIPTFSQALRWFREKYDIKISFAFWNGFNCELDESMGASKYELYIIMPNSLSKGVINPKGGVYFDTHEEAELACLTKLIEIVEQEQTNTDDKSKS
jgi:hypothetical protein